MIFILGNLPCILTYGPLSDVVLLRGKNIFDTFDFISGNVLFVLHLCRLGVEKRAVLKRTFK